MIDYCHTFLLDASGVLYNEKGVIPQAVATVRRMQARGAVFVVTNNSCHSPAVISAALAHDGYQLPADHIFSSGYGLSEDPDIAASLRGKTVFFVGYEDSKVYMQSTGYAGFASLAQADVIVISSSIGAAAEEMVVRVKAALVHRPRPVICCNPDHYVRGLGQDLIPVAGYYAAQIEAAGFPVHWIGKPLENYSQMIARRLKARGVNLDAGVCFFDDNPVNVMNMQMHLGISGCWIRETGIGFAFDPTLIHTTYRADVLDL